MNLRCPKVRGISAAMWRRGIAVEMEHTSSKKIAKCVSAAHFEEFGEAYYRELAKMERKLKRQHG